MVGHRQQRNVHQTAGKVSWLYDRLVDMQLGGYTQVFIHVPVESGRYYSGGDQTCGWAAIRRWLDGRLSSQVDTARPAYADPVT